jgi:hypothetical protein
MPYVIRGRIGADRGVSARTGIFTYLAETGDHFYIWDGLHKVAHFATARAGLEAAALCNGPWFNTPDPASVEAVLWLLDQEAIDAREAEMAMWKSVPSQE